ncbi:PAS domain S-box protein [Haloarchaeobius sp. FL176]|uniref:PAS domain S-box protein n=1 Tax=Haloarchaeobius sp. FL176 TaxID=2967129 RepID=UPI002148F3C0|nr:PAS domain S-box protein [Haloarchaeobius sp. FL176]
MSTHRDAARGHVALGLANERNRELLRELLAEFDVNDVEASVPAETDLCIVDETMLARSTEVLSEWQGQQHPAFAPVLLLADPDTADPWQQYTDELGWLVDAILTQPTKKAALVNRVQKLLEMREISSELATEHQLIERVFGTSPLAKLVLDSEGRVVRANEKLAELFGERVDDLEGRRIAAWDWRALDENGEEIPASELPHYRALETGRPVYQYEHRCERCNGEMLWLSVNMAPITDLDGDVEYVVGSMEDITVRRTQRDELDRQLDLFRKAQDIAKVGAWEYDSATEELYWTEMASVIHGTPEQTPQLEESFEYFHPEDRPTMKKQFQRALQEGIPYDSEARLVDDAGVLHWVRVRGQPQYEAGDVVRIRGTIQDITDRKERELELRHMSRAVDEAPIGVTISDPSLDDNPLIYVNEKFCEMTGYSREEALGRNCRFLQGDLTDERTVERVRNAIEAQEPVSVVLRNYRDDGTEFWNNLQVAPVRDEDGELVNFIGFQQDVSDRVERDRQLTTLDRYLRHNLRNEMSIVQGLAEQIQTEGDAQLSTYADEIQSSVESLLGNVEKQRRIVQILQEDAQFQEFDLISLLDSIVDEYRSVYPDAEISLSGPDSVTVSATEQLPEVFSELVENAVRHDDTESPRVSIEVTSEAGHVTVEVADDGPGIPDMDVNVLTGVEDETAIYHGDGLGLWLVYLVLHRSRGSVHYTENDPRGAVVSVVLSTG